MRLPFTNHYQAIIWTEDKYDRPYCMVGVGQAHECGSSTLAQIRTAIRTDDPGRHQAVLPEAERILAGEGWQLTGGWEWNGYVLQAPARKD